MIRCNVKSNYSLFAKIKLAWWLLKTKISCPKAKLFCYPLDLRGKKYIDFGKGLSLGIGCRLEVFSNNREVPSLVFGSNVQINDYVHIVAMDSVMIGNNVLMASHIFISDNSHGSYKGDENDSSPLIPPIKRHYATSPISIGENSWIGEGVIIMPGTSVGKGCIIGAHSIVRGVIPDYSIAVGNPARIIKKYDFSNNKWIRL